jgi:hypothetical protein
MLYEDNDNKRIVFIAAGPAPKAAKQATASPGSCSIQELPPESSQLTARYKNIKTKRQLRGEHCNQNRNDSGLF